MNKLYVVTAVHNRFAITQKFIKNLKKQSYNNIWLVLIDDGSNDGTDKMVVNELLNCMIIYGDGNLWWGGALQKAYEYLCKNAEDNDNLLITNDDINFESDFLEQGINLLNNNKGSLITSCGFSVNNEKMIDGAIDYNFVTGEAIVLPPNSEGNCASTRALFLNIGDMKEIGGFHPVLLPHYGSDYEYTIRAFRKGLKIKSFNELRYTFDEGTTGYNDYKDLTFKKIFSKKSVTNPFYKLSFIFLATPLKYIPKCLLLQLKRYVNIGLIQKRNIH